MKKKKIFLLFGGPEGNTRTHRLTDAYEVGAVEGGHEVRRMDTCDMDYDPILHKGYREIQPLEPDLVKFQENLKWAEHFVIIVPVWWSSMPALLKGLFDRAWLPGFAFRFYPDGLRWKKLLKGKSSRVIITSDSYPLIAAFMFGESVNELTRGILKFAGISVRTYRIGLLKFTNDARFARLLFKVKKLGRNGK
jgi:NAD(P)H dehydrogenase (quinone)